MLSDWDKEKKLPSYPHSWKKGPVDVRFGLKRDHEIWILNQKLAHFRSEAYNLWHCQFFLSELFVCLFFIFWRGMEWGMMGEGWGFYGGSQGTLDKKKWKWTFARFAKGFARSRVTFVVSHKSNSGSPSRVDMEEDLERFLRSREVPQACTCNKTKVTEPRGSVPLCTLHIPNSVALRYRHTWARKPWYLCAKECNILTTVHMWCSFVSGITCARPHFSMFGLVIWKKNILWRTSGTLVKEEHKNYLSGLINTYVIVSKWLCATC